MSTLGGLRTLKLELHVPPSGAWWGTATLDASTPPLVGPTVLEVGDLTLLGAVLRTSWDDHPDGALVTAVVRGGAGWRLPVANAGIYGTAGGVRLLDVVRDLAGMAGELYVAPTDASLGVAYSWQAHDPLAPVHLDHVLADLVTRGYLPTWRVEPLTGLTRFDAWPTLPPADGRGRILRRNLARGRRTVGLDVQVAAFLPGASLELATIDRLVLHETATDLRADVYSSTVIP